MSTLAGPTTGAEKSAAASEQWEARPGLARVLRFGIFAAPLLVSILFTWTAGRVAPPESLGMNRWLWIGCVFVLANVLLALLRKATSRLVPLVALMKMTLVFPDQAPSRTKATLRQSNSRRLLREIEEAEKRGEDSSEIRYADYLVQLLKELNDHDRLTRGHSERVRAYAEMIGEEIGLNGDDMNKLRWSALLHDVGKLSVPPEILNSPGRPTDEEWKILSDHPASAVALLAPLEDWLGDWVHSADQHHCRWDGKGYPYDLAGTDISLAGRLVAIADAFDVMTSTRSYKKPLPVEVARQELTDCAGGQFDPSLVRAFLRISLGRLRFVGGPLAWLANLTGSFQIPVPAAGTVTGTVWSTGVAAAGIAVASTTGAFAETPPELLSFSEPIVVAYDSEQTMIEGDERVVTLLVSSTGSDLVITLGEPENGTATITRDPARRTPGFSAIAEDDWRATVIYSPAPDFQGVDRFSFRACTDDECDTAEVKITVLSANEAPTVNVPVIAEPEPEPEPEQAAPPSQAPTAADDRGDGFVTSEDAAFITGSVLSNDDSAPLDAPPTVTVTSPPQSGSLQNNGDGTFWYSPLQDFNGEDTFLYTIESSDGMVSENAIVTITVLPVADAPQAVDDAGDGFSLDEGQSLTTADVTSNDIDVDGELSILRIDLEREPRQGSVVNNGDGTFDYTPDDNASGTDSFEYVLVDTDGLSSLAATVTISIVGVNDAPIAVDDEGVGYTVLEDDWFVTGNVLDNDSDVDSELDAESIVIVQSTTDGELISLGDGTFRYTPDPDVNGTDRFTYTIADADGAVSEAATATIVIRSVNDGPIAVADRGAGFSTDEDTPFTTADVTANDVDGEAAADPTTTEIADGPSHGTIVNNGDGTFTYTPDANFNGIDTFSYAVADTDGVLAPAVTVTLVINAVNDPLVLVPDTGAGFETVEDAAFVTANVLANDVDPDDGANDDRPGRGTGQQNVLPYTIDVSVDVNHGELVNHGDGTFGYEPEADFNGTDTFSYTVIDAEGVVSLPGVVTLTVVAANDAPVANDDAYETFEDLAFRTGNVVLNDADVEDDMLSGSAVELVDRASFGTVTSNGDGTFDYAPDQDANGTDSFTYRVLDSEGAASAPAMVTITVRPGNDPPVAAHDGGVAFTTPEDSGFTTPDVAGNDSDIEDGTLDGATAVVLTDVTNGVLVANGDGTFDYTPNVDFFGTDSFTYTVNDTGLLASNEATVTITVTPVNDAPVAADDAGPGFVGAEDTNLVTANVLDNDTDVEDATLDPSTVLVVASPLRGQVVNNGDGTFTYAPDADTNGADTFAYVVADVEGALSAPAVVTVEIAPINDAPVAQADAGPAFTTDEDAAFTTPNVASNDSDTEDGAIDPTAVTVVDSVSSGTLTNNGDGTFDYKPEPDASGTETFTYTVTDSMGAVSDTAEVMITIRPINDAPVAVDDAGVGFTGAEDAVLVTANILANDIDVEDPTVDPATIIVTSSVSFGTLDSNSDGTFDYTPSLDFDGEDEFTYIIEDSGGLVSNPATVTLSMIASDDPPVAVDDEGADFVTDEDTTLVLPDITANDSDPEDGTIAPTAVTIIDQPTNGTLEIADDGTISYIPNDHVFGADSFTYKALDASLLESNLATVTVDVRPVNDEPVAADDAGVDFSIAEDATLTTPVVTLNDSDVEDGAIDPTTAILVGNAVNGTATSNGDGTFDFTPASNFVGTGSFTYVVTDSDGGSSAPARVLVEVTPVNDRPVAVNDSGPAFYLEEDVGLVFSGNVLDNDTDVEDATLLPEAIEVVTDPARGDLVNNGDGTFGYLPDENSNGTDSFTYRIADSGGAWSDPATVSLVVAAVNDAPVAGDDSGVGFATNENTRFTTANVTSNDGDIEDDVVDASTVAVVDGPNEGSLTNNGDGTFDYEPGGDFNGQDSFTYTVEDADGELSAPATVTIFVEPANDPPVAKDDGGADFTTDEDTGFTTPDLTANDSDPEDGSVDHASVVIVSNPAHGLLLDNGDGTFVYTPTRNFNGTDTFTYRVEDSEGLSSNEATVTVVIEPINDAPELETPPTQELVVGDPYSLQIEVNDVESDWVAFSVSGFPAGLSLSSSGLLSGAVPADGEGHYDVTVTVSDAGTPSATTTITFEMIVRGWSVSALEGTVMITEILPVAAMPPAREFVEITNAGSATIDLADWQMLDFNLRVEGAGDLHFIFGDTDASGDPSLLEPGEQAVVWLGSSASATDPDEGLEYVIDDGIYKLGNSGDDVWLLDPERRIVDYVAYGDGSEAGVAPPADLGLWDDTFQAQLVATMSETLVLTPHGVDSNSSACWEPVESGDAIGRCDGALPTFDIDNSLFVTSVGLNNNAFEADAGGAYEVVQGEDLALDASGTPNLATGYAWDLDGDDDFGDASGVAATVTWEELVALGLERAGEYEIALDAEGSIAPTFAKLTILDDGVVIAATGDSTALAGIPYSLTLTNDDQGAGGFVEWTVNWGDGNIKVYSSPDGSPITVDHAYNGPGLTYDILVSGTDSNGVVHFDNKLIVPSFDKDKLYVYDETGSFVDDPATTGDSIEAEFGPDGLIYVSSEKDGEIRRHDPETGAFIDIFVPAGTGGMDSAGGLAFGPYGDLFVANPTDSNVLRFDGSTGALIGVFASTGLVDPYDIVFDSNTNMYVNDYNTHEIRRYSSATGELIDVFVAGEAGTLKEPEQMAFGPDGNLYVASFNNHKILRFSGIDGSYIDTFIDGGSGDDDTGNPANLHKPTGIAFGPDGNLYVADHQDHSVLRFNGTTGAFIDEFVAEGEGGMTKPDPMTFAPTLQVTVS
jgi:hypothetical protein